MATTSLYTTTRITGLVSSLDTDSIVKQLMQIEQLKVNRELRKQTTYQWKQDALNSVASDLRSFRSTYLTSLGTDGMMNVNTYTSYNATLTGNNKDAVTISASAEAAYTKVTINKITQLASSATASSSAKVSASGTELSEGNYVKLGDLEFANSLFTDGDEISFEINGESFTFNKDTTLATMFSTVNNSDAGVTMSYSRLTDGFSIASKSTGADQELTIKNVTGNAFGTGSAFGIEEYGVTGGNAAKKGENAVAYINGTRVERSANTFKIDGIQYTLNYTTGTEEVDTNGNQVFNTADAITVNLTKNVDSAVEKITKFIEGYNTMVNKLYSLVNEKKDSDYYALTDDEKAEMTEAQIESWEGFAKAGLLRNDRDIQNVLSNLRTAFYTSIEGVGLSAQDIGIRTNGRSGEITINEDDLRAALETDSDAVMRVFMGNDISSQNYEEQGLLYRLDGILKTYVNETQYNTLESLENNMTKLATKISDMEDRMADLEEKYYLKYAAMETALAKLQSQSDYITSMLGTSSSK